MKHILTATSALVLPAGTELAREGNGEPLPFTAAGG